MQEIILEQETLYSLFNSTAQITAIFSIILLTGLSVICVYLDTAIKLDESRADFYLKIKEIRFKQMVLLSVFSFLTVFGSFMMILFRFALFEYQRLAAWVLISFCLLSIATGFSVVLSIMNPNKFHKAAEKIISENKTRLGLTGEKIKDDFFFQDFIRLEQKMKEYILSARIGVPENERRRSFQSFRQMVETLFYHGQIDRELYDCLQQINKYRNLVFHGHIHTVDAGMMKKVAIALEKIISLFDNLPEKKAVEVRASNL